VTRQNLETRRSPKIGIRRGDYQSPGGTMLQSLENRCENAPAKYLPWGEGGAEGEG
jgi:hypothetical protein